MFASGRHLGMIHPFVVFRDIAFFLEQLFVLKDVVCLLFGCFAVLSFSHRAAGEDSLFLGTLRQIYHVGGGSHLQSYILSELI